MKVSPEKKIFSGFSFALLILIIIGVLSYYSITQCASTARLHVHTLDVLKHIGVVLSLMNDAETGGRGYIITGDDKYLEPYNESLASIEKELNSLKYLTADNPHQKSRIDILQHLIEDKYNDLGDKINLRKDKGFEAASQSVLTGEGRKIMDKIRGVINEMKSEEMDLVAKRDKMCKRHSQNTLVIIFSGGGFVFAITLVSVFFIIREPRRREKAEEQLRERAQLANLVAEISVALIQKGALRDILQRCCGVFVRNLNVAFARIWTLNRAENMLELQSSAGIYTHIDGAHARVPVGKYKIGLIAEERKPHLTNVVVGDTRIHNQAWAKQMGMVAFAGYPLIIEDRVVGVMAMFAQRALSEFVLKALGSVSESIALFVEHKLAEDELFKSMEQYRLLVENIPDVVWTSDISGNNIFISSNVEKMTGYKQEEFYRKGADIWFGRIHPDDIEKVKKAYESLIASKTPYDVEYRYKKKDENWIWVHDKAITSYKRDDATYVDGIFSDITAKKQSEIALQKALGELKERSKQIECRNQEIALLAEMAERLQIVSSNEEAYSIISFYIQKLFPEHAGVMFTFDNARRLLESAVTWGSPKNGESVLVSDNCWALRLGRLHKVDDPKSGLTCAHFKQVPSFGYMCIPMVAHGETMGILHLQDKRSDRDREETARTEFAESKRQLVVTVAEHMAQALANIQLRKTLREQSIRDPLTDLFNRRYMNETLELELRRVKRSKKSIGIVMLDIDHFKLFNDKYGHEAGDVLLRALGDFLRIYMREGDIVCRYGGEEFALVLIEASLEDTRKRAEELQAEIKKLRILYRGKPLENITISLGVSVFPEHGTTVEDLLRAADQALYKAKTDGRDRLEVFAIKEAG
ncbi:MAG TPA: diguanylate cyclase [Candidatus Wujingus californicus]|uniref:diguanylate cyclase n=1 Tax=Candidatus Wujingus californicus TaxID=3367618 RepID=UPI00402A4D06